MSQEKKAKYFASLHKKGAPILLYNAWDSGSAVTIQGAGAKAIATSSWSVADAQGYEDGGRFPASWLSRSLREFQPRSTFQ